MEESWGSWEDRIHRGWKAIWDSSNWCLQAPPSQFPQTTGDVIISDCTRWKCWRPRDSLFCRKFSINFALQQKKNNLILSFLNFSSMYRKRAQYQQIIVLTLYKTLICAGICCDYEFSSASFVWDDGKVTISLNRLVKDLGMILGKWFHPFILTSVEYH